jgi:hypothetical protein
MYLARNSETPVNLTPEFYGACDPDISFDAQMIVFSGKKTAQNRWQIWQMSINGSAKKQISGIKSDCFMPVYAGNRFYLNDPQPTPQIIFVSAAQAGKESPVFSLYGMDPTGETVHRLTFNLFSDTEPDILPDGRIVYSSWQTAWQDNQLTSKQAFMAINNDGTDVMPFYGNHESPVYKKKIHISKTDQRVYIVESDQQHILGGGDLASLSQRRPLGSYRRITHSETNIYHSPLALPGGDLLVSYASLDENSPYSICRIEPESGVMIEPVFADKNWHSIDVQLVRERQQVKGRSNWLIPGAETGVFYCLNSYRTNLSGISEVRPGDIKSVRVLEGIPEGKSTPKDHSTRRILGVAPVQKDGSFHIRVPAEIPLNFQLLDKNSMAIRKQEAWVWVIGNENRGCIGCHENKEMSPPNVLVDAVTKPPVEMIIPAESRRTIDFHHDIAPLIQTKCAISTCHVRGQINPNLEHQQNSAYQLYTLLVATKENRYVIPGWAIKSPLISIIMKTDENEHPEHPHLALSEDELRLFIEWIDLGAFWDLKEE